MRLTVAVVHIAPSGGKSDLPPATTEDDLGACAAFRPWERPIEAEFSVRQNSP